MGTFWCRKLQFLYDIWRMQLEEDYEFAEDELELANDTTELEKAWKDLPADHPAWPRLKEIKDISPRHV